MRLGVDPRKADQMVRGTVNLPHGTGKTARVIVFAAGDKAAEAEAAGADVVGSDELVARIQEGWLDFDAAIATPDQMAKIGRIARILGPRGLMPNPKTGTVTMDVTKAVNEIKGGKITFRVDKHSNLHLIIGKASFSDDPAGRQLRRRARRGPAGEAVRVEGQVPAQGQPVHDDGPGHSGRPERHAQPGRGGRVTLGSINRCTAPAITQAPCRVLGPAAPRMARVVSAGLGVSGMQSGHTEMAPSVRRPAPGSSVTRFGVPGRVTYSCREVPPIDRWSPRRLTGRPVEGSASVAGGPRREIGSSVRPESWPRPAPCALRRGVSHLSNVDGR